AAAETLSDVDRDRFENFAFMSFNGWEYLYYQRNDRSIPINLWRGADAYFKGRVATAPGLMRFWEQWQTSFDEPFRSYVAREFAATALPIVKSDASDES